MEKIIADRAGGQAARVVRNRIGADDRPVQDGTPTLNSNLGEVFCSVLSTGKTLSVVVHGKDIPMSSSAVNWMQSPVSSPVFSLSLLSSSPSLCLLRPLGRLSLSILPHHHADPIVLSLSCYARLVTFQLGAILDPWSLTHHLSAFRSLVLCSIPSLEDD